MVSVDALRHYYATLNGEAESLAGGLSDLAQRATVYHHLFEHSGRNHIFPLIAAHGALWANSYFRLAYKLGRVCSWQYLNSSTKRNNRMAGLEIFADAFRDINRRVCIDTYCSYHFSRRFGGHLDAEQFVKPDQLEVLNRCHYQREAGQELSVQEKRNVFRTFFLNEQETVVSPSIKTATSNFDWPIMKTLALRPILRFAYFGRRMPLFFRNFADQQERIEKGLAVYDIAAKVGWQQVEASLREYNILPEKFFHGSKTHYEELRDHILVTSAI